MRKAYLSLVSLLIFAAPVVRAQIQGTITTVAGGVPNNVSALQVDLFASAVFETSNGSLYISGGNILGGYNIYKVDASGQLTTVAGNGTSGFSGDGGPATSAQLNYPFGLFVDSFGNIFFADSNNNRVREVVAATGNIQTVAGIGTAGLGGDGGPATSAQLNNPSGVFVDSFGNIFISDAHSIREVVAATGNIHTVAGNGASGFSGDGGPATSAQLDYPAGVFIDSSGNIFIADSYNNRIREVVAATGNIQTVAGSGPSGFRASGFSGDGGPATSAQINNPADVFVDSFGNIFIADSNNNRVREVFAATGNIQTVAGNGTGGFSGDGGPATSAQLNYPSGVFVDTFGNILIAASSIREVIAATGNIQTVAGSGTSGLIGDGGQATSALLNYPSGVFVDSSSDIFIVDSNNCRIREVVAATGNIQTVAGNGTCGFSGDGGPANSAELFIPSGVFVDSSGNIFIADSINNVIRDVVAATGNIQTVAGNGTSGFSGDGGPATNAQLRNPTSVFVDRSGNIFIADSYNNVIREVVTATGNIQTVAGNGTGGFSGDGGPATSAQLNNFPSGVFVDSSGNIFIADTNNHRIREVVAATGNIQTVAGDGVLGQNGTGGFSGDGGPATSAQLNYPSDVFVDSLGNVFIVDTFNYRIREVVTATGNIQTIAGNGIPGFSGDGGPATNAQLDFYVQLGLPVGLWADSSGNLFFSDIQNWRIRSIAGIASVAEALLSSSSLTFSGQILSAASQAQTITLTNGGNAALTVTGVSIAGTNSGDFKTTNGCGATVAPTANCTFQITFTPTALGNRTAALVISDNAIGGPQSITLSGQGTDFSMSAATGGSTSATLVAGQMATFNLQVSPLSSFTGSVTLACSGAPAHAACTPSTTSLNVNGTTPSAFTVTVTTTARSLAPPLAIRRPFLRTPPWPIPILFLLAMAMGMIAIVSRARPARTFMSLGIILLCGALLPAGGCGGSSNLPPAGGTPPGNYILTVTGTEQGVSHTLNLTLTVK